MRGRHPGLPRTAGGSVYLTLGAPPIPTDFSTSSGRVRLSAFEPAMDGSFMCSWDSIVCASRPDVGNSPMNICSYAENIVR
jgi:hypothetical protein